MAVDPVTDAVIAWLVSQLGTAGSSGLGRLIGGDKQQRALHNVVREAVNVAVEEVARADADVLREALLVESPDIDQAEVVDVLDLTTALGRLIHPRLAALAEQGYAFDADLLTGALFRHVMAGVEADAARDGPLAPVAEFLRHERLAVAGEQAVEELREIRRDLSRLQFGGSEGRNEIRGGSSGAAIQSSYAVQGVSGVWASPERVGGLPGEVDHFTGRQGALGELIRRIDAHDPASLVAAVHVFDGMPGVGKTAFVIHAAHVLAGRYPDGAMFVDLLGFTGPNPLSVAQALTELLAQAGVPRVEIPGDVGPKQVLWQRVMRRRRSLIVLDNARNAEQVQPLLPEAPGCLVLITGRSKLYDINATPLPVDVLIAEDARSLFVAVAGADHCRDSAAVDRIVTACHRLPLAIRLLASRVRHGDPVEEIAADVEELHAEKKIRGVFQLSYESLDEELQQAFRLLGVYPGFDVTAEAMAALADLSPADGRRMLRGLATHNLIDRSKVPVGEEVGGSRYRLHDLLRDYARSVATEEETTYVQQTITDRLVAYYRTMTRTVERLQHGESDFRRKPLIRHSVMPLTLVHGSPLNATIFSLASSEPHVCRLTFQPPWHPFFKSCATGRRRHGATTEPEPFPAVQVNDSARLVHSAA